MPVICAGGYCGQLRRSFCVWCPAVAPESPIKPGNLAGLATLQRVNLAQFAKAFRMKIQPKTAPGHPLQEAKRDLGTRHLWRYDNFSNLPANLYPGLWNLWPQQLPDFNAISATCRFWKPFRAFFEGAGIGGRFHERLLAPDSQLRPRHKLAVMVNPAEAPMAESEVQGKACHHV
jgi:hypothetical protein